MRLGSLTCRRRWQGPVKLVSTAGTWARPGGKVEGKQAISGQTQKRVLALLRRVRNEAKVDDLVEVTPCAGVRVNEAPEATQ